MKIALLGYGVEGKSAKRYFEGRFTDSTFDIFENESYDELQQRDYSSYDIILRSPSVPPMHLKNESSVTKYFFDHCPCPIIGVTATKGKGTTCSMIKALLDASGTRAYLVGNIGTPALDVLDELTADSVVVYEMSSFQLWDLKKSPHISVIGHLEPDHLNVHHGYADYLNAKGHIAEYQTPDDYCIYNQNNAEAVKLTKKSSAHKIPYPFSVPAEISRALPLPGAHNQMNFSAALAAVACYKNISPDEYCANFTEEIIGAIKDFKGLPHRLEFVRVLNGVDYYDDNFSTNPSSTRVALESFPGRQIVLILGGRDKTDYTDLPEIYEMLRLHQPTPEVILIGESGHELYQKYRETDLGHHFTLSESLEAAVNTARQLAEPIHGSVILMSPAAASFDMFKNVYDRGARYQEIVNNQS